MAGIAITEMQKAQLKAQISQISRFSIFRRLIKQHIEEIG